MPVTAVNSTNLSISSFNNFYDAPTTDKRLYITIGSVASITYPNRGSSNVNIGGYVGSGNYLFYLKAVNTNGTKGTVSMTYPWSQSTNVTNGYVGGSKQAFTPVYSYISLSVSVNYGYTFSGWYTAASGGTLITGATSLNVSYTNAYRDSIWYAVYV